MSEERILSVHKREGMFIRTTGYSLHTGVAVAYALQGHRFRIIATRLGVDIAGSFPVVKHDGVETLIQLMRRAVRHYEHLASFANGQRQTVLNEDVLDTEESVTVDVSPSMMM